MAPHRFPPPYSACFIVREVIGRDCAVDPARWDRLGSRAKPLFLLDAFDPNVTEVGRVLPPVQHRLVSRLSQSRFCDFRIIPPLTVHQPYQVYGAEPWVVVEPR